MYTVSECIENKKHGLHYGSRLILPFKANYLKIILDKDIYTDFSPSAKDIHILEHDSFTDIYFPQISDLPGKVTKFEAVKMLLAEKDANIFNSDNHIRVALYLEDDHIIKIEKLNEDILFIE